LSKKENPAPIESLCCSPVGDSNSYEIENALFLADNIDYGDDFDVFNQKANRKFQPFSKSKNTNTSSTYALTEIHSNSLFQPYQTTMSPTSKSKFSFNSVDVELLTRLLDSKADSPTDHQSKLKPAGSDDQMAEIQSLMQKFYMVPLSSDSVKIDNKYRTSASSSGSKTWTCCRI
jgi:hypothetical protein